MESINAEVNAKPNDINGLRTDAKLRSNVEKRFWPKVSVPDGIIDECWNWNRSKDYKGYGQLSVNGKPRRAHRISFVLTKGEIPSGMFVCHSCDNPPCINPVHLFLGTCLDNMRDCVRKKRLHPENGLKCFRTGPRPIMPQGELVYNHKLSQAQVDTIRAAEWKRGTGQWFAAKFGVTKQAVFAVKKGVTWKASIKK
jgi:hypothetical protein